RATRAGPAIQRALDVGALERPRLGIGLIRAGGHFDPVAKPAIDLDDDRDLRPAQQRLVELGPGLENDEPFSALALPQLLGKVRRRRAEHAGHPESRGFTRLL